MTLGSLQGDLPASLPQLKIMWIFLMHRAVSIAPQAGNFIYLRGRHLKLERKARRSDGRKARVRAYRHTSQGTE